MINIKSNNYYRIAILEIICVQTNFGSFESVTYKLFIYKSCIWYIREQNLALYNPQWLICHKTQPTNHQFNFWTVFAFTPVSRTFAEAKRKDHSELRDAELAGFLEVVKVTNHTELRCRARLILAEYYSSDLSRWWKWRTTLDCEMLSSPDTLWALLTEFAFI